MLVNLSPEFWLILETDFHIWYVFLQAFCVTSFVSTLTLSDFNQRHYLSYTLISFINLDTKFDRYWHDLSNISFFCDFRGLFIIDTKGILRQITMNDLPVGRSVDETLRLVQAFQFTDTHGEVCPANWKPGSDTVRTVLRHVISYKCIHTQDLYYRLKHFLYYKTWVLNSLCAFHFCVALFEQADTEGSLFHHLSICLPIWLSVLRCVSACLGKVAHVFFGTFVLNIDGESRFFSVV